MPDTSDNDNLEETITNALENPLRDASATLDTIVRAIINHSVDRNKVEAAVKLTINNYENQLRVFMIAVANSHLPRISRLLNICDELETQLQSEKIIKDMDAKDLLKSYALMQSSLVMSLDYVKKIADMRMELQQHQSAITSSMTNREMIEIDAMSGLPKLDSNQRSRVRTVIEGMLSAIKEEEDSTEESDEEKE